MSFWKSWAAAGATEAQTTAPKTAKVRVGRTMRKAKGSI